MYEPTEQVMVSILTNQGDTVLGPYPGLAYPREAWGAHGENQVVGFTYDTAKLIMDELNSLNASVVMEEVVNRGFLEVDQEQSEPVALYRKVNDRYWIGAYRWKWSKVDTASEARFPGWMPVVGRREVNGCLSKFVGFALDDATWEALSK